MIKPRMYASYLTPKTDISQTPIYHKQMSHNPYGFELTVESETILVLKCRVSVTESKCQNQKEFQLNNQIKKLNLPQKVFLILSYPLASRVFACPPCPRLFGQSLVKCPISPQLKQVPFLFLQSLFR